MKYLVDPGTRKLQVVSQEKWGERTNELVQLYNRLIMRARPSDPKPSAIKKIPIRFGDFEHVRYRAEPTYENFFATKIATTAQLETIALRNKVGALSGSI